MKARVKSTGEIISVKVYNKGFDYNGRQFINYEDMKSHKTYADNQLDFDNTDNSPDDYWARLEHQYAGMAMQGMLNNSLLTTGLLKAGKSHKDFVDEVTYTALRYAHALVEKLKEKEERK